MTSLKSFRKLLDQSTNYGELVPHIQEILGGKINTEFGNSLLHTLSLLNENHLTYQEWEQLHDSLKSKLDVSKFNDTTYHSIVRLFCSTYGYEFVEKKVGFNRTITGLLQEMETRKVTFRRRTFFPIFQRCFHEGNGHLVSRFISGV